MSDKLRRCRSIHPDDPSIQCVGEVTDLTTHIEDHWNGCDGKIVRWPHVEVAMTASADPRWRNLANPERVKAEDPAGKHQVGGDHYRAMEIQPWDIITAHELTYFTGNVVNYILRAGQKGSRLEDLRKARHYLDKAIELEEKEG